MTLKETSKLREGDTVILQAGADVTLRNCVLATYRGVKRGKIHVEWEINGQRKSRLVLFSRVRLLDERGRVMP